MGAAGGGSNRGRSGDEEGELSQHTGGGGPAWHGGGGCVGHSLQSHARAAAPMRGLNCRSEQAADACTCRTEMDDPLLCRGEGHGQCQAAAMREMLCACHALLANLSPIRTGGGLPTLSPTLCPGSTSMCQSLTFQKTCLKQHRVSLLCCGSVCVQATSDWHRRRDAVESLGEPHEMQCRIQCPRKKNAGDSCVSSRCRLKSTWHRRPRFF